MGIDTRWHPSGLQKRFFGTVSQEEVVLSFASVQKDPRYAEVRYQVNDFTRVLRTDMDPATMKFLAATYMHSGLPHSNYLLAFVCPRDDSKELALTLMDLLPAVQSKLFSELAMAKQWIFDEIGLEPPF